MRKLLILLIGTISLASCTQVIDNTDIVERVEKGNSQGKYIIFTENTGNIVKIYTNIPYSVGDTIKFCK